MKKQFPISRRSGLSLTLAAVALRAFVLLVLFVSGASSAAVVAGHESTALPPTSNPPPYTETGTRGVAVSSAVVNFREMAEQQAKGLVTQPTIGRRPAPRPQRAQPGAATTVSEPATRGPTPLDVSTPSPAPASSFVATDCSPWETPPDTMGAVGPNHLMVTLNGQVRVLDRNGGTISSMSDDRFWSGILAYYEQGLLTDPALAYDPFAGRWIYTIIKFAASPAVLVGVSESSDPTANWSLYRVDVDPAHQDFADFPRLGFNNKWIVVAARVGSLSSGADEGENFYVFNKANLYAHGIGAYTLLHDSTLPHSTTVPSSSYTGTTATMYLLRVWNDSYGNPPSGYLRLSTITGPVGSEVLTLGTAYPAASPWANNPVTSTDLAPQLGSTQKVSVLDYRLQNLVYRNSTLYTAHTVFLPAGNPARSSVQWWSMLPNGGVLQFGRIDDPSGQTFYGFPSIAVNARQDVLIGFSRFSSNTYPSAAYAYRSASDAINTMRTDWLLKAGEAPYGIAYPGCSDLDCGNRWGDFSATVVDPLNDLDMWTIQEYSRLPGQIYWGTWWGRVTPGPVLWAAGQTILSESCSPTNNAVDPGETVTVNLALKNVGAGNTTNLTATLRAADGVVPLSGSQVYGALAANGAAISRPFSFRASGLCGGGVTATLDLADGGVSVGSAQFHFTLGQATCCTSSAYADLAVSAISSPAQVVVRSPLSINLTVSNAGPATATQVVLTNPLPPGSAFLSASTSQGICSNAGGQVTCQLGSLPAGAFANIALIVTSPTNLGPLTNTCWAAAAEVDPNLTDNAATTIGTTILCPLFTNTISGSITADDLKQGGLLSYAYQSVGPCNSAKVCYVSDEQIRSYDPYSLVNSAPVPVEFTVMLAACSGTNTLGAAAYLGDFTGEYGTFNGGLCQNHLADAATSTNSDGSFSFCVPANTNAVLVIYEVTPGAGCANYTVQVIGQSCVSLPTCPDLALHLSYGHASGVSGIPSYWGERVTFSASAVNQGFATATNLMLVDTLPPGFSFLTASTPTRGGTCTNAGDQVSCLLGDLTPQTETSFTIVAQANTLGTFTNRATVSHDGCDLVSANDTAMSTVFVNPPTVAVSVTPTNLSEAGPLSGAFTIRRSYYNSPVSNGVLVVNYALTGTASNGVNYLRLSGSATIPEGAASAKVTLTPIDDGLVLGNDTVILTLLSGTNYVLDNSVTNATITISEADVLGIVASSNFLRVPEGSSTTFTVQLNGPPVNAPIGMGLQVNFARAGGDPYLQTSGTTQLRFRQTDWNVPQPLTIVANEDPGSTNGVATFTLSANGVSNVVVTAMEIDRTAPPQIAIASLTNGHQQLQILGYPGSNYVVEATTNLVPPANLTPWLPVSTGAASGVGVLLFTVPDSTNFAHRFFRARTP